jgi:opacity protein-like surface antigen
MTAVILCCAAAAAAAQEPSVRTSSHDLPTSIADWTPLDPSVDDKERPSVFSLGPAAGYLKVRDADRGTWFGGVQARLHLAPFLAVEGSITFHRDEFQDGDVEVTQYPVQVTALLFPFPHSPFRPYALAGGGWYYTHFEYSGLFSVFEDETDSIFGFHVGAGAELHLGPGAFLFADFRWVFLDEPNTDNSNIRKEKFDYGQVTLGLGIKF